MTNKSKPSITEIILQTIADIDSIHSSDLLMPGTSFNTLGFDSLDFVEMLMLIEDSMGKPLDYAVCLLDKLAEINKDYTVLTIADVISTVKEIEDEV